MSTSHRTRSPAPPRGLGLALADRPQPTAAGGSSSTRRDADRLAAAVADAARTPSSSPPCPATSPTPRTARRWPRPPAPGSTCWSTTPATSAPARCRPLADLRRRGLRSASSPSTPSPRSRWSRPCSRRCGRPAARCVDISSDAAVEAYAGWGGYGASKAALDQLTAVLAVEHPELRVYAVDPGDMATDMHQAAFPGEDISDRPAPETRRPGAARA